MRFKPKIVYSNIILLATSVIFSLIIGEIITRAFFKPPDRYYAWPPNYKHVFYPDTNILPGISGRSVFISNSIGIRGDELDRHYSKRLLAVGGSTTICLYLDQDEAWPQRLQNILNNRIESEKYWIGNSGKSGLTSEHYLLHLKYLAPQIDSLHTVLVLSGINDLSKALAGENFAGSEKNEDIPEAYLKAFHLPPIIYESGNPLFVHSYVYKLIHKTVFRMQYLGNLEDKKGRIYKKWREHRKNAADLRKNLPDLSVSLETYSSNINSMIDLAEDQNLDLIFLTQPVLWNRSLSEEEQNLLWMGGIGNFQNGKSNIYYSIEALREGMRLYNEKLIEVCQSRNIEYIDLANLIPPGSEAFYDDCHFNEYGSNLVAEIIADKLLDHQLVEISENTLY